ncbi:hypothetical protein V8G54_008472 [Vigna mungo]|uniref:MHD domain-containing protein n=1 Tax=Vigna mungo TaxID=3915 RepID=A0AAQ3P3U2_VIGMU
MSFVCKRGQSKEGGHELSELKTEKTEEEEEEGKDDIAVFRAFPERRQHRLPRLAETFFRKVKFWKEDVEGDAPPVFGMVVVVLCWNIDGVNYFHVKVAGLLFVATTRVNVSPSLVLELLQRIARVIKDYLGVLNEDSFRKNFVLVYELLDEVIDFGYVQTTSTEVLKSYIFNEPIVIDAARMPPLGPASIFMQGTKRMPGTAITKSVVANEPGGRKRDEIFVDVIEKISVTFNSSVSMLGFILTSEIDGTIQMKSYLSGNPEIRLALNEDLSIGTSDDCNFHESVHLDSFEVDRTLSLVPPDGEFPVMNYRMTQPFKPPFRITALIEETGPLKAEVTIKVRAEFNSSTNASTVLVQMPLPSLTARYLHFLHDYCAFNFSHSWVFDRLSRFKSLEAIYWQTIPFSALVFPHKHSRSELNAQYWENKNGYSGTAPLVVTDSGVSGWWIRKRNEIVRKPFIYMLEADLFFLMQWDEPGAVGHTTDFKETNRRLEWGLKKVVGGSEHTLRAKLTFSQELHGNIMKEAGPVSMTFTIPMYNASRLQVKYLQIAKKSKAHNPYRWVRYVTEANSYVARL